MVVGGEAAGGCMSGGEMSVVCQSVIMLIID